MIPAVSTEPISYEERRGWTPRTVLGVVVGSLLVLVAGVGVVALHVWLLIVFVLFFGLGLLAIGYTAATHAPALLVDQQGVTLTRAGLPGTRPRSSVVPWPEIGTIVLSKPAIGGRVMLEVMAKSDGENVDPNIYKPRAGLSVSNWCIDAGRLTETVRSLAPTVSVLDKR
jgi:hypothetical protein